MASPTLRRTLIAAFLFLILLAASLSATPLFRPALSVTTLEGLMPAVWNALKHFWSYGGCTLDPDGGCVTTNTETPDEGCTLDPNGRCATAYDEPVLAPRTDEGCTLDPDGACRSVS